MKHKAKLTISRPSYGDGRRKISIQVEDSGAKIRFLDIEIDPDKFAECITGLSHVECSIDVRGLENIGKMRESMPIEFEIHTPGHSIDNDEVVRIARENTPDGWVCSEYFGSQKSFFTRDGKEYARTTAHRWVEK